MTSGCEGLRGKEKFHMLSSFLLADTGDWTQGLTVARQELYHLTNKLMSSYKHVIALPTFFEP